MTRRTFVQAMAGLAAAGSAAGASAAAAKPRFVFKARGGGGFLGGGDRLSIMNADGTGLRMFEFHRPSETGFGLYDFFKDGRRGLVYSVEMNEEWKTRSFYEYYHRSRTRICTCDLETGRLDELATRDRIAPFIAPYLLLPGEERMLVSVNQDHREALYSMDLDGSHAVRLTDPREYVYGVSASPDGKRVAFHADYRIYTMGIDGSGRKLVAGRDGWIYFGTSWSPDGEWVLFQVCNPASDPGHDWSDIWIGRPDGSDAHALTEGASAWFASSYGPRDNPGSGSVMPKWAPDGSGILYARKRPGTHLPWPYATHREDTTHYNRDYRPEQAAGGTDICIVDPRTRRSTPVTGREPAVWEWRPDWSPDSKRILFCRAGVGENPSIWVMDRSGRRQRRLTDGAGHGAEFPRWAPPARA